MFAQALGHHSSRILVLPFHFWISGKLTQKCVCSLPHTILIQLNWPLSLHVEISLSCSGNLQSGKKKKSCGSVWGKQMSITLFFNLIKTYIFYEKKSNFLHIFCCLNRTKSSSIRQNHFLVTLGIFLGFKSLHIYNMSLQVETETSSYALVLVFRLSLHQRALHFKTMEYWL